MTEKFNRYQQAHSCLHDPEVLQSSVELIPVTLDQVVQSRRVKRVAKLLRVASAPAGTLRLFAPEQSPPFSGEGLSDPFRHKSLTSYVLWLKTATTRVPHHVANVRREKPTPQIHEPPNIRLTSLTLAGEVELFQGQRFEVEAPGARKVELVWRRSNSSIQRVSMDHGSGDRFKTNIGLDDDDYLFGYSIDGWMRPDHRHASAISLRSDGVWSRLKLSRHERLLVIQNRGKVDESLRIESTAPWLAPFQTELVLPSSTSVQVGMHVLPSEMVLGVNDGSVQVHASRDGKELTAASLTIEVVAKAGGAVGEFKYEPAEFGWIMQGDGQLRLDLEVVARGAGPLAGMVMLRHSGALADFRLDPANVNRFQHTFVIESSNLPHLAEGKLKLTFVTDSYLANYRLFEAELPYRLIYLKKSLPALSYGCVQKGATRTLRLDVERSDGKALELDALIPDQAKSYLEAYRAGPSAFSFRFDTRKLPSGDVVKEVVTLVDRSSGLSDHLNVLAEVGDEQMYRRCT